MADDKKTSRRALEVAAGMFVVAAILVVLGIWFGFDGARTAATASSLQNQANSAYAQYEHALATSDANVMERIVSNLDSVTASADAKSATRMQLWGPGLIALGSALGGAVLGWGLTQVLGSENLIDAFFEDKHRS
jgi:hypothetical protein